MAGALRMGAFAVADAGSARFALPERRTGAVVDVAVGIVQAADGRVLLAERTARQISPGFWELPGGKIDPGETPAQAAARELREEVGIAARTLRPWIVYEHSFPLKRVRLHFFRIDAWDGTPHGREGQRVTWADPAAPAAQPLLASNRRVLAALALPATCVQTPGGTSADLQTFIAALPALAASGVRLVKIREPHLAPDARVVLARRIGAAAARLNVQVMLSGSVLEARRAGIEIAYVTAREAERLSARPPVGLCMAECHDPAEAERAIAMGADALLLEPVFPDAPHAGRVPLGWDGFARLASALPVPVFAGGALTPQALSAARRAGAAGIVVAFTDVPGGSAPTS